MAGPKLLIEAPVREDREGGIETVATFRDNDRLGAAESVVFQSDGCEFPKLDEHHCYTGEAEPDAKTFAGIAIDDAIGGPFPMYAGIKCTLGPDEAEFDARARAALANGQGRELEAALAAWAAGGTALTTPVLAGIAATIGRVEQALGVLEVVGGQLQTKLKTPVIASGRVTAGTVFGTGAIVVEHSETKTYPVLDPTHNQRYALAEAVYVLAVDCEYRVKSATT